MDRTVYGTYATSEYSFAPAEVDAVVGFFTQRGHEEAAAVALAARVLEKSKQEAVNVFTVLDRFKSVDEAYLNRVLHELVNTNSSKTSVVGFRNHRPPDTVESRNVVH